MNNMKKKHIALFVIFILILGSFGACKKAAKGIVMTDNEGKTRVLATNDKGETMTDEAGNLIIMATGVDGEQETQRVAMPDYYVSGKTIEAKHYTLLAPKGWEQSTGLGDIRLTHQKTQSEINLVTMDGKTLDYAIDSMEQLVEPIEEEGGTVEKAQATVGGVEAAKYTVAKADAGTITFYIFEKNEIVYSFYAVATGESTDSVDFEAIFNSIVFK